MSSSQQPVTEQPRIDPDAVCRICHEGDSKKTPLYHPCLCKGSIRYIHENCLTKWLTHNKSLKCEVCGHSFIYKPIFVKGQQIPSSISYKSLLDILCWIYDELITKNSDLILRLPIILFMWFIICPFIIFGINHTFYRYCILYDLIHFNSIYAPLQSLRHLIISYKSFHMNTISIQSILSYFCPFHSVLFIQNKCNQFQISMYYIFVNIIFKGILFIVLSITLFGVTICMKNTAKIVRPPQAQNNPNDIQDHNTDDEKEIEIQNDYKSPSLLVSDDNYNPFDDDYDADDDDASESSTLSELEMKLNELQQRIKQKKEERKEEKEQEINDVEHEDNPELDELDMLLDSIGLNDDIKHLVIKHICWILWLLNNHISHFIVPHFMGQHSLVIMYVILWIFSVNHEISQHILDLMDLNQYNEKSFIYSPPARHLIVVIIGYCSCFVYQWILCKIMPWMVTDLQQFVHSSVFSVYLWLFDKKDILKGCFFLGLKFVLFPFILTMTMECCFIPIREESQWTNYTVLYETFILHNEVDDNGMSTKMALSVMYVILMMLWTSIAICTYLSTVDVLEKTMRPTAFTYLFRSVIETKNWIHPFSYQEQSVMQLRKWCMTTLHFMVVIFAFLGIPSYVMSQCNHIVPLNVPSVGKIKTFHVRSLLLQDYVLLFSVLPMLLFWEPIFRALVVQTLHMSAYLFNLKFYLLRNYNVRDDEAVNGLNQNVWHNEQPFMDIVEDNHVPLPDMDDIDDINDVNDDEDKWFEFETTAFMQQTVAHLVHDAIEYSIHSLAKELDQEVKSDDIESAVVQSITKCIEFMSKSDEDNDLKWTEMDDMKQHTISSHTIHRLSPHDLKNVEAVIDYVSNDNMEYGDILSAYRIKWRNCSLTDATWEHIDHLEEATEHIDRYEVALRASALKYEEQILRFEDDQMLLAVLWSILHKNGGNTNNKYGVIWMEEGTSFVILNVDTFTDRFLVPNDDLFYSLVLNRRMIHGKHYELFCSRMCVLGFERRQSSHVYYHPCFNSKSNTLLKLIGKNTVSLHDEKAKNEEESEEEDHRYYAAFLDEPNNEIIEIAEPPNIAEDPPNENVGRARDGMDMMGLFDGIDLGGADNIIPAPIVMNVQLDNFGRLIKINVELDTYNEAQNIMTKKAKHEPLIPSDIPNDDLMEDAFNHLLQHTEHKEENEEKKEAIREERVHIAELMRSLNSYQKSELLRDILSICHPLYITESKYGFIYGHNTKSDVSHPLLRVLKKPSELISVNDIVTFFDKMMLYFKILSTVIIAVFILNSFHLILFLQCLVYGRKLWKILSLVPKFFIFELGFTNFTRFDHYGIMSFAFNEHTIHDLHCIALSLWWFPAMYGLLTVGYHSITSVLNRCSQIMDHSIDFLFSPTNPMSNILSSASYLWRVYILGSIKYLIIFCIHHIILPLLFGFCFFFSLWSPVFIGCNQSFSCSILEAWIEGFFVWNVFLPIMPLRTVGDPQLFKERFKVYLDTKFENMNLWTICKDIYWPLLRVIIIHLFIPIAFIRSSFFKYLLFDSMFKDSLMVEMKNSTNIDELLFEFNRKWYLRYIMRKLLQLRLFMGYQRAIRNGCDKIWDQFINDKYVVGKRLVNYYYNNKKDE